MADAMMTPALERLRELSNRYKAAHARHTESDTPLYKAWKDNVVKKAESSAVELPSEPFTTLVETASETKDATVLISILAELEKVRETVESFLHSMFSAETHEVRGESLSREELDSLWKETNTLFEKVLGMEEVGFVTKEEISSFCDTRWTQPDPSSKRKSRFVWAHPGRVMEERGTQVRENSKFVKIEVDGEIVGKDGQLGVATKDALGISVGNLKVEFEKVWGEDSFTDHANYAERPITLAGKTVRLVTVEATKK